jgi:hypothetical protein
MGRLTQGQMEHKREWRKIERKEGLILCDHCKENSCWGEWGEDGSHSYQPDQAHVLLEGVAYPYEEEDALGRSLRPYRLYVKVCQTHMDYGESPNQDYYYIVEKETKI